VSTITVTLDKRGAVMMARYAAFCIRQMVKAGEHQAAINAANLHRDRFLAALDQARFVSKSQGRGEYDDRGN
jgi:hypothetical protein